jgi:hypothetical protein
MEQLDKYVKQEPGLPSRAISKIERRRRGGFQFEGAAINCRYKLLRSLSPCAERLLPGRIWLPLVLLKLVDTRRIDWGAFQSLAASNYAT